MDKAKNIMDAYALLHLEQNKCVVIGDYAIINPLEIAEVKAIVNPLKDNQYKSNIVLNVNTSVDVEKIANELAEKINKVLGQRL